MGPELQRVIAVWAWSLIMTCVREEVDGIVRPHRGTILLEATRTEMIADIPVRATKKDASHHGDRMGVMGYIGPAGAGAGTGTMDMDMDDLGNMMSETETEIGIGGGEVVGDMMKGIANGIEKEAIDLGNARGVLRGGNMCIYVALLVQLTPLPLVGLV